MLLRGVRLHAYGFPNTSSAVDLMSCVVNLRPIGYCPGIEVGVSVPQLELYVKLPICLDMCCQ
jgi:hypothetical protein